jgi:hypothetical protein
MLGRGRMVGEGRETEKGRGREAGREVVGERCTESEVGRRGEAEGGYYGKGWR